MIRRYKCDEEIFRSGTHVLTVASVPAEMFDVWVQAVAVRSGQRVDWHSFSGRCIVRALSDLKRVFKALDDMRPQLERTYREYRELKGDADPGPLPWVPVNRPPLERKPTHDWFKN